jgi:hypothetical protein
LEQNTLNPEKEKIIEYLIKYGNTQLSDLENYGTFKLNLPQEKVQEILADMLLYGELKQVIHEELSSPIVYATQGDVTQYWDKQTRAIFSGSSGNNRKEMDAAHEILCDAAEKAEKRIKKKMVKFLPFSKHET